MKMKNETIAQEAKRLLEPIPEEQWTDKHGYSDGVSKCCALGHWNRLHRENVNDYHPFNCCSGDHETDIDEICKQFFQSESGMWILTEINDAITGRYAQPTPKQRIMALLDDMITAGY